MTGGSPGSARRFRWRRRSGAARGGELPGAVRLLYTGSPARHRRLGEIAEIGVVEAQAEQQRGASQVGQGRTVRPAFGEEDHAVVPHPGQDATPGQGRRGGRRNDEIEIAAGAAVIAVVHGDGEEGPEENAHLSCRSRAMPVIGSPIPWGSTSWSTTMRTR